MHGKRRLNWKTFNNQKNASMGKKKQIGSENKKGDIYNTFKIEEN